MAALLDGADGGRVVMVTTAASPVIAHVHDRMPALLIGDQVDQWLDPTTPPSASMRCSVRASLR